MSICDAGYERCDEYREQIDMLKARLSEAEGLLRGPIRYALTAPTDGWKGEVERNALDAIRAFLTPA